MEKACGVRSVGGESAVRLRRRSARHAGVAGASVVPGWWRQPAYQVVGARKLTIGTFYRWTQSGLGKNSIGGSQAAKLLRCNAANDELISPWPGTCDSNGQQDYSPARRVGGNAGPGLRSYGLDFPRFSGNSVACLDPFVVRLSSEQGSSRNPSSSHR